MQLSLLLIVLISLGALPQQVAKSEKELKRQRERAQAVLMVEQTAAEAPLWDDKKAAVTVLADAADLFWKDTPATAKEWLTRAWDLIDSVSAAPANPNLKDFTNRSNKSELQSIVLRVAHAHDRVLAETFIKSLEDKELEEKKGRGAFDDRTARSEQFLRLAQQAVETNPELAFALAQRSLADGLSFTLQNVLTSLRRKNVDLSNRLFDLALARFGSGAPDPGEAEVLAGYLFQPGMTFSTNSAGQVIMSMNPMQRNDPIVAESEPQRARAYLVAAYQAFLSRPFPIQTPEAKLRAQKVWVFGTRNIDRYNTFATEFAGPARDFLAQLQTQIYPEGRGDPFSPRQSGSGTDTTTKPRTDKEIYEARVASLEDRADKEADPVAKKQAYVIAVLAVEATDYDRAKRIADKIADDELRDEVGSYVLYRAALAYVTQKDHDKALELAAKLANAQRRAMVKIAVAQGLITSAGEGKPELTVQQQRAFDLLSDVERDMKKEVPSASTARILLGRATLLGKLDKDQALVSLDEALLVINKLDAFDLNDEAAPRLGLRSSSRSEALLDSPRVGFSFRRAIKPLIETEFENLADLAGRFNRKEVRGTGRLEVAKLYLQTIK